MKQLAVLALTSALFFASCGPNRETGRAAPGADTTAGPVMHEADGAGVLAAVRSSGARAVLVNVWASWCQPCREEFPDLLQLERKYRAQGFRLILVSADFDSDLPQARKFLTEQQVTFPTWWKVGDDMEFINALDPDWSGALPGSFLYDGTGRLVRSWEGKASYATLEQRLRAVLDSPTNPDSMEVET
jgi:thiol-disulfide isomerase/thioredoxin